MTTASDANLTATPVQWDLKSPRSQPNLGCTRRETDKGTVLKALPACGIFAIWAPALMLLRSPLPGPRTGVPVARPRWALARRLQLQSRALNGAGVRGGHLVSGHSGSSGSSRDRTELLRVRRPGFQH